jgi:hypothetical protein
MVGFVVSFLFYLLLSKLINVLFIIYSRPLRLNASMFAIEFTGYGPAEGLASQKSIDDNFSVAYRYLLHIGYFASNIVLMGCGLGLRSCVSLCSELCSLKTPPAALISISGCLDGRFVMKKIRNGLFSSKTKDACPYIENIKLVTCPSLFIHGAFDKGIPISHAETIHKECGAYHKRIAINQMHDWLSFREPVDSVKAVEDFLHEFVEPLSITLKAIPSEHLQCPTSVINREKTLKNAGTFCLRLKFYSL